LVELFQQKERKNYFNNNQNMWGSYCTDARLCFSQGSSDTANQNSLKIYSFISLPGQSLLSRHFFKNRNHTLLQIHCGIKIPFTLKSTQEENDDIICCCINFCLLRSMPKCLTGYENAGRLSYFVHCAIQSGNEKVGIVWDRNSSQNLFIAYMKRSRNFFELFLILSSP
jgi:hypothetical protein